MRRFRRPLVILALTGLLTLLLAGAAAGQTDTPAAPPVFPGRVGGDAMDKLAPDLRALVEAPFDRDLAAREVTVTALLAADAPVEPVRALMTASAVGRPLGDTRRVSGTIRVRALPKLATADGLYGVVSTETFAPLPAPGLDELRELSTPPPARALGDVLRASGKAGLEEALRQARPQTSQPRPELNLRQTRDGESVKTADIHNVAAAYAAGYTGEGVLAAVVDSGVDFGNPDLQGTQARLSGGPYDGWPFAYDTVTGFVYAAQDLTIGPDNWAEVIGLSYFVHMLPVTGASCSGGTCSAELKIDYGSDSGWPWDPITLPFTWDDTSQSGKYFYSIHPDFFLASAAYDLVLGYGADFVPAAIIVADEAAAGVYDTVYVDADFDQDFTTEKPMRRGDELGGADLFTANGTPGTDGVWDLSASMLSWISDGVNPPPGVGALYEDVAVPEAGRLVAFISDGETHGTNVAGMIAGQSRITDPAWVGMINPLFAGAADVGGVGGPVAQGMAPDARIVAFQSGYNFPLDAWTLAALGMDGAPETGDETQLVNNSWGDSEPADDGWDFVSRFAHYLNRNFAPTTTFLSATGNGGAGYGTAAQPNGATFVSVGASTSFGSLAYFDPVTPEQFTWGGVIPFSNRGPGAQDGTDPDLVCVGAFGTGVNPLNWSVRFDENDVPFATGQGAYDIFGGTSMASPVCTGVGALVYQAYAATHGQWPNYGMARELMLAGANDLGYDGLAQGSGNADAGRSTAAAAGTAAHVSPAQWNVGGYRGQNYEAYAAVAVPGQTYKQTLTLHNPTGSATRVDLRDRTLVMTQERTYQVTLPVIPFTDYLAQPNWITDISSLVNRFDPDLMVAQVMFPYESFDPEGNFDFAAQVDALFYDWTDRNGNGSLWTDANNNGSVERDELDFDENGVAEFNRFSYAYAISNNQQVNIGRDALSRRHDGVFLGLRGPYYETPVTVSISLRFYKKANWNWLTLSSASVNVPAGGTADVTATVAVPGGARPGLYQGAIEASGQIIPVVVQVAAGGPTFNFAARSLTEPRGNQPYDNGHVYGMIDWGWRPETGDWRYFFYDVPDGTAAPGRFVVVDTAWNWPKTDVDTLIFGAAPDDFSTDDPEFFGPSSVALNGRSANTWFFGGVWQNQTATGGPREVVSAPISDGLGFVVLHNVLNAGREFGEPVVGRSYQVDVSPYPAEVVATPVPNTQPVRVGAEWTVTFTSARAIPEGLGTMTFGLGRTQTYANQTALQDNPNDPCTASYITRTSVAEGGGKLTVATTSAAAGLDIDLFVLRDNGNGVFDCGDDLFMGGSATFTAEEFVDLGIVEAGQYWILVHGWQVPGGEAPFDLTVRRIDGQALTVSNLPTGGVQANRPVRFQVRLNAPYLPGTHEALLYVGPKAAPTAIEVPITVEVPLVPGGAQAFAPAVPVMKPAGR